MITPKRFLQRFAYHLSDADFERELSKLNSMLLEVFSLGGLFGIIVSVGFYVIMHIGG